MLSSFGTDRVVWASDWPPLDLVASYQRWHDVSRALLAGLAKKDRAMIFGGNTERIYRL